MLSSIWSPLEHWGMKIHTENASRTSTCMETVLETDFITFNLRDHEKEYFFLTWTWTEYQ